MGGVAVDIVIVLVVVGMSAFGYRSGLLKAASSLLGLAVGLVVAVPVVTYVGRQIDDSMWRLSSVVGLLVLIANAGYIAGMLIGSWLRSQVRRPFARGVDRAAGGVLSTLVAVLLVWMLALPLGASPVPGVSQAVKDSVILPRVDALMPDAARTMYEAIDGAIDAQGLPDVVGPLQQTDVADVGTPDGASAAAPAVVDASRSVVKVVGQAPQCNRIIDGSGFAYAPDRVATNAHVVAGTETLTVQADGNEYAATVVYADESLDLAVLDVDGLDVPPLGLNTAGQQPDADVVVVGYPGGGNLTLAPAKVRGEGKVTGPSFRGEHTVTRDVLMMRGSVVPGNSGGPVLDTQGEVVGVVFGAAADQPDVGYALTIDSVDEELAAAASAQQKVVTGACYP